MAVILRATSRIGVWMTRIVVSGVVLVLCWYHGFIYGQSALVSRTDPLTRNVFDSLSTPAANVSNSIQTDPPMQVIIVTKMRSGSSFTAEIFNRNDDFVYYYEPLNEMTLDNGDTKASFMGVNRESVLNDIVKCNFSNFNTFNWWNGRRPRQQCAYSTAYQASLICNSCIQGGERVNSAINDTAIVTNNEAICRSRKHIAIKTVRIPDIGTLKALLTDTSLNVKIVHLVRDPRARSNSATDIHDPDDPSKECEKMENNLQYWLDPPDWIRGRYMLLRYEDLAERPHYILDAVYSFLNLTAPSSVGKWFDLNTKHNDNRGDKWSHTRDSNKTAHAWRKHLLIKFDKMLKAQRDCAKVMRLLGYKTVRSSAELSDTEHVSTLDRPKYPLQPTNT